MSRQDSNRLISERVGFERNSLSHGWRCPAECAKCLRALSAVRQNTGLCMHLCVVFAALNYRTRCRGGPWHERLIGLKHCRFSQHENHLPRVRLARAGKVTVHVLTWKPQVVSQTAAARELALARATTVPLWRTRKMLAIILSSLLTEALFPSLLVTFSRDPS